MERFIESVRRYPCLWDTASAEYRDHELKDAAWAELVKDTDAASVKEVKQRWKKLRDSYRDALKRQSELQARDAPPAKRSLPWKYMGPMQFLQPHMSARKKRDSPAASPPAAPPPAPAAPAPPPAHNGDARSSSSSSSGDSSPRRGAARLAGVHRKLDYLCRAVAAPPPAAVALPERARDPHYERRRTPPPAPPDPLDIFFNGMCQTTKRFPYATQVRIKKLLFGAVMEAEEALVAEQQSYASLWARGAGSSSSSDAGAPDAPSQC